jgi:hypothetical protein
MSVFEIFYWGAIVVEMAIRAPISQKQRKEAKSERRELHRKQHCWDYCSLPCFSCP